MRYLGATNRMNSLLILLLVVITTCNVYVLSAPAEDFDYEFSKVQTMAEVRAEIKETGKPGVVFVTQPWCGACKGLKVRRCEEHIAVHSAPLYHRSILSNVMLPSLSSKRGP